MSDPILQRAGKLLLEIGLVVFVVGFFGSGFASMSTGAGSAFEGLQLVGALYLILGAIAWALSRTRSMIAPDQVNVRLRRAGFLLFIAGVLVVFPDTVGLALTRGSFTWPIRIGTVGFYLAIVGAVIVAVSHRRWARPTRPTDARS